MTTKHNQKLTYGHGAEYFGEVKAGEFIVES
jgi:hypothetical protein